MKFISIWSINKCVNLCTYIGSTWYTCILPLQSYRDITSVLFCRLINVDILLLFLTIFICYKAEIKDNRHIFDAIYTCTCSSLSRSYRYKFHGHLIPSHSELWRSDYNRGLVIYGSCAVLVVQILPWTRFFCNVHLFRVPRSWTGNIQMKPCITFIRGNRCIERERKIILKSTK